MQDVLTLLHPVHQNVLSQTCKEFRFLKQECSIEEVLEQESFYLLESFSNDILFKKKEIVPARGSRKYYY